MKVRRYFVDAETGKRHKPGDTYKGRPERVAELQASGHLPRADQPEAQEDSAPGPKTESTDEGVTTDAKPGDRAGRKPAQRRAAGDG